MPFESPTDQCLLSRYVANDDQDTFRALVERHGPDVMRVCRWVLRDGHEAEDAFQATFLLLVRKAPTIRDPELLGKWLRGAAYRTASKARRHTARRTERERKRALMSATQTETDSFEHDVREIVRAELDRLPETYRAPLVLCYLEGFSHEEAAKRLEWPAGTVKTRLVRARKLLRERVERRGVALGAGLLFLIRQDASAGTVSDRLVDDTVDAMVQAAAARQLAMVKSSSPFHAALLIGNGIRSATGHLGELIRDRPVRLLLVTAVCFFFGLIGAIAYSATDTQPPPLTELPREWLAPNLTNVLAVDCR